jgi:hypothetical protein
LDSAGPTHNERSSNAIAEALIEEQPTGIGRVLGYREFDNSFDNSEFLSRMDPLPELLTKFNPVKKPILWLRLTCFAYICNEFVRAEGLGLGFEDHEVMLKELLRGSADPYITKRLDEYEEAIRKVNETRL